MRARCNCILSTNQRLFDLVWTKYTRNYNSNHFALRAGFLQRPTRCHTRYFWGRRAFLLSLQISADLRMADTKFQALKALNPPLPILTRPYLLLWISLITMKLIDEHADLWCNPHHHWNLTRAIKKSIWRSLLEDSQRLK